MIELVDVEGGAQNRVLGETDYMCRICLDEGERRDFIAPCRCSGTSKWVHRHCLDRWRSIREDKAFSQCMECHAMYEIECISSQNPHDHQCKRRMTFCALVIRDFGLILATLTLFIMVVTLIVYFFDSEFHHQLLSLLNMEKYPILCYAGVSIALILAYVGTHFTCVYMQICSPPSVYSTSSTGGSCRCCDDVMFMPYYVTPDLQPSCCCLECGRCSCCDVCGNAAAAGTAEGSSGAATSCSCCECAGAEAGHELLVVMLAVFVVLAVIGLVVAVFVGTVILQSILSKHLHVLGKWTMTKEYIVKDLADGAVGLTSQSIDHMADSDPEHEYDVVESRDPPSFADSLYTSWGGSRNNRSSAVRRGIHFNYQAVDNHGENTSMLHG